MLKFSKLESVEQHTGIKTQLGPVEETTVTIMRKIMSEMRKK